MSVAGRPALAVPIHHMPVLYVISSTEAVSLMHYVVVVVGTTWGGRENLLTVMNKLLIILGHTASACTHLCMPSRWRLACEADAEEEPRDENLRQTNLL